MGKDKFKHKVVAFVPSSKAISQFGYEIPNDTVKEVEKQIESQSDYIIIRPKEFDGRAFRICVAKTLGIVIVKELVETKSGIIADAGLVSPDGKRLN